PHSFTKDVCVVKLDKDRFLPNFRGNVIELGVWRSASPIPCSRYYPATAMKSGFEWLDDRLLELRGILPDDRMHHPDKKDHDGENCLFVIKRGLPTIGRATGCCSYAREYFPNQMPRASTEWAVLPYDHKSRAFSESGESGSMISYGTVEFGGLITGGCGETDSSDLTYAAPMFWLWPIIQAKFPHATFVRSLTRFVSFTTPSTIFILLFGSFFLDAHYLLVGCNLWYSRSL
ncbi:hypothetical protein OE88DRAFT_1628085, partial [Heliocybe sulcata]